MVSRWLYLGLVGLVALQRLGELRLARRNEDLARKLRAVEVGAGHYPWIVAMHALFLMSCPLEVWSLERPFAPALAGAMLLLLGLATGLRYWAISTLGERWTTRVFVRPGLPPVRSGPYRWLAHPNYVAVVIEFAALPLIHSAWLTAAVFSAANLLLLSVRIDVESAALRRYAG